MSAPAPASASPKRKTPKPDHYYPLSPSTHGGTPSASSEDDDDSSDDEYASKGIPVFKPSMEEFEDFYEYIKSIDEYGMRSGIVKVIPPKEWTEALPSLSSEALAALRIKSPIAQHMLGRGGLFRQTNVVKRRVMGVDEWAELAGVGERAKKQWKAPAPPKLAKGKAPAEEDEGAEGEKKEEEEGRVTRQGRKLPVTPAEPRKRRTRKPTPSPPTAALEADPTASTSSAPLTAPHAPAPPSDARLPNGKRKKLGPPDAPPSAETARFLADFDPMRSWLPEGCSGPREYTPEACAMIERMYWRSLGLGEGEVSWYGADLQGSLFTDSTTSWNVAHLPSYLTDLLRNAGNNPRLPGVNTPYLYFGIWRATFAWHVEDMDLYSINYIHFGAPKFWYAIPQKNKDRFENTMAGYFPPDVRKCPEWLRHKSFLASPNLLAGHDLRPNVLVQHQGEFVITYPHGYHAGFNMGFNCAESVNFATERWEDYGRKARHCACVGDSVRIDVDALLAQAEELRRKRNSKSTSTPNPRKRKSTTSANPISATPAPAPLTPDATPSPEPSTADAAVQAPRKKIKLTVGNGSASKKPVYPCVLCASEESDGLLRVIEGASAEGGESGESEGKREGGKGKERWAHKICAGFIPETWIESRETPREGGDSETEEVVRGVQNIPKARWGLRCSLCTGPSAKTGCCIQCTKGKCARAFHVTCALKEENHTHLDIVEEPPPPPAAEPEAGIEAAPQPQSESIWRLEALCKSCNPAYARFKAERKAEEHRHAVRALVPGQRIKVRIPTAGVFEVGFVSADEGRATVEVVWGDGTRREIKAKSVLFNADKVPVTQMVDYGYNGPARTSRARAPGEDANEQGAAPPSTPPGASTAPRPQPRTTAPLDPPPGPAQSAPAPPAAPIHPTQFEHLLSLPGVAHLLQSFAVPSNAQQQPPAPNGALLAYLAAYANAHPHPIPHSHSRPSHPRPSPIAVPQLLNGPMAVLPPKPAQQQQQQCRVSGVLPVGWTPPVHGQAEEAQGAATSTRA